jgi:hypothetical protein
MCKQAERDHESKKLAVLIDRVKRQIADRDNPESRVKRSAAGVESGVCVADRRPSRTVPFER